MWWHVKIRLRDIFYSIAALAMVKYITSFRTK